MKTLCYNINTYELKEIESTLLEEWVSSNNPKGELWTVAPEKPDDSYIWNNGSWIASIPVVPDNISARQIRLWLVSHNISLSTIENAINSIEDATQREVVKIEWCQAFLSNVCIPIRNSFPLIPGMLKALSTGVFPMKNEFTQTRHLKFEPLRPKD